MVRPTEGEGTDGGLSDEQGGPIYRHRFAIIAVLVVFTAMMVKLYLPPGPIASDARTGCQVYAGDRAHHARHDGEPLPDVAFVVSAADRVQFTGRREYWCGIAVESGPNRGRSGWALPGNGRR